MLKKQNKKTNCSSLKFVPITFGCRLNNHVSYQYMCQNLNIWLKDPQHPVTYTFYNSTSQHGNLNNCIETGYIVNTVVQWMWNLSVCNDSQVPRARSVIATFFVPILWFIFLNFFFWVDPRFKSKLCNEVGYAMQIIFISHHCPQIYILKSVNFP